jgi:hypothetical protein
MISKQFALNSIFLIIFLLGCSTNNYNETINDYSVFLDCSDNKCKIYLTTYCKAYHDNMIFSIIEAPSIDACEKLGKNSTKFDDRIKYTCTTVK